MFDLSYSYGSTRRVRLAVTGLAALVIGVVYYAWFRSAGVVVTDPTHGTFPALVHMLGLTLIAMAIAGPRRGVQIASVLLLISVVAEWRIGLFDPLDALMLVAGFLIGCATASYYLRALPQRLFAKSIPLVTSGLVVSAAFMIGGSACYPFGCSNDGGSGASYRSSQPVYMDYQTLRTAVKVSEPKALTDVSRLYVYEKWVFLNQKNQGIHVLNNSDPTNPINIAFIEVPGNTELSIRNNFLYVDSYVDLVTLNISDPNNVMEVDRELDIFPYDEYQNVPDTVYFNNGVDQSRGVVISYERI